MVKRLPAIQENKNTGQSLGWEDPLEKGMATHSNFLAWEISWIEEPGKIHTVHQAAKSETQLKRLGTHPRAVI